MNQKTSTTLDFTPAEMAILRQALAKVSMGQIPGAAALYDRIAGADEVRIAAERRVLNVYRFQAQLGQYR